MKTFSFCWVEELGREIRKAADALQDSYCMELIGKDVNSVIEAVNQGIDSRLETCFIVGKDQYLFTNNNNKLRCLVSPESLVVLVRRLMESENDNSNSLATEICETLGIELI